MSMIIGCIYYDVFHLKQNERKDYVDENMEKSWFLIRKESREIEYKVRRKVEE